MPPGSGITGAGTGQILCRCPRGWFSWWFAPQAWQALSLQAVQPQPGDTHAAAWCWGQCRQTKGVGWKRTTAWVCETLESCLTAARERNANQAQSHRAWAYNCLSAFFLITGRSLLPGALELPALLEQPGTIPRTTSLSPGQDNATEQSHLPLPLTTVSLRSPASSPTPLCSASLMTCPAQVHSLLSSSSFPADAVPAGYPETHRAPCGH